MNGLRRLGLALFALAAVFAVLELAVRLIAGERLEGAAHQGEAGRAWAAAGMLLPVEDGDLRYVGRPGARLRYGDVLYRHNRLGLRGPEPASPKPSALLRILVLGDSVAYGWGVAEEETFARILERRLRERLDRPVEVVVGALPGYNTRDQAALLERLAPRLEPDVVLVAAFANDIDRFGLHVDADGFLFADPLPVPGRMRAILWRSRLYRWISSRWLGHLRRSGAWVPGEGKNREATARALSAIVRTAKRSGALTLAAWCPLLEPGTADGRLDADARPDGAWAEWFADRCAALGVPFLDLFPAVEGRYAAEVWVDPLGRDHHPSALAHRLFAERLLSFVLPRLPAPAAASR